MVSAAPGLEPAAERKTATSRQTVRYRPLLHAPARPCPPPLQLLPPFQMPLPLLSADQNHQQRMRDVPVPAGSDRTQNTTLVVVFADAAVIASLSLLMHQRPHRGNDTAQEVEPRGLQNKSVKVPTSTDVTRQYSSERTGRSVGI